MYLSVVKIEIDILRHHPDHEQFKCEV